MHGPWLVLVHHSWFKFFLGEWPPSAFRCQLTTAQRVPTGEVPMRDMLEPAAFDAVMATLLAGLALKGVHPRVGA
jgi:hypothetical protein